MVLLETGTVVDSISGHRGLVSCLSLSERERYLVTGSKDCTLMVWDLKITGISQPTVSHYVHRTLMHQLYGHAGEILSVSVSEEYQTIVSGSDDSYCLLYNLKTGICLRRISCGIRIRSFSVANSMEIFQEVKHQIVFLKISIEGQIAAVIECQASSQKSNLYYLQVYDINGKRHRFTQFKSKVNAIQFDCTGKYLLAGTDDGVLSIFSVIEYWFN